jgi:hypothetical protein
MLNTPVLWDVMLCQWVSCFPVFQRITVPSTYGPHSLLLLDSSQIALSWRQKHCNPLNGWEIPMLCHTPEDFNLHQHCYQNLKIDYIKKCCSTGHMKGGLCHLLPLKHWNCGCGTHSRHRCVSEFFCGCAILCTQKPCTNSVPHLSRPTNCIKTRFRNP